MTISLSSASVAKHDNRFRFGEQGWKNTYSTELLAEHPKRGEFSSAGRRG